MGVRLGVVKQSFFGLPGQYGRRVTKANMGDSLSHLDNLLIPVIASSDRNLVRPYSTSEQRVTLCYFLKAMLLVQEKMCYVLDTFVPPCFFFFLALASWSRASRATFTRSQSYSTSLFCHANSPYSR